MILAKKNRNGSTLQIERVCVCAREMEEEGGAKEKGQGAVGGRDGGGGERERKRDGGREREKDGAKQRGREGGKDGNRAGGKEEERGEGAREREGEEERERESVRARVCV